MIHIFVERTIASQLLLGDDALGFPLPLLFIADLAFSGFRYMMSTLVIYDKNFPESSSAKMSKDAWS